MTDGVLRVRPIQAFDDNIGPAKLMLHVYRLLDSRDGVLTEGDFVSQLRELVKASATEDLMVVQNEIFVGLVRECARLPPATLKRSTLCHLLRQSVVASCTALDAYLPALLRVHLPEVINLKGRAFLPSDEGVRDYFKDLSFSIEDVLRLIPDENATLYISNKILGLSSFKYLAERKGIHVVGALLGLAKPWDEIAGHLHRDKKELMSMLEETVRRRNDIVHRADRSQNKPDDDQQAITYAQARQGVDTIEHVCMALNELVEKQLTVLRALLPEGA